MFFAVAAYHKSHLNRRSFLAKKMRRGLQMRSCRPRKRKEYNEKRNNQILFITTMLLYHDTVLMSIGFNKLYVDNRQIRFSVQKIICKFIQNANCEKGKNMITYKRRKGESNVQVKKNLRFNIGREPMDNNKPDYIERIGNSFQIVNLV